MSTVMEKLAAQQEKALEVWVGLQKPVVDGVRRTRTVIGERAAALPIADRLPKLTVPAELPDAREVLRNQFGFAEKVLATNKQFALNLVDAVSPLPAKVAPKVEKVSEKVAPKVSAAKATVSKAAPKRARARKAADEKVADIASTPEAPAAE